MIGQLNKSELLRFTELPFLVFQSGNKQYKNGIILNFQRSCLYSMDPIEIGSKDVEFLSSYISRVVIPHCITVGDSINI